MKFDVKKVYLVHHETFVPHEGISKYRVYPFLSRWEAEEFCVNNSKEIDVDGYIGMYDEDTTQYIIDDGWSPEYMYIRETEVMDDDSGFKNLYKW